MEPPSKQCIYDPICVFKDCYIEHPMECYRMLYFEGHVTNELKDLLRSGGLEKMLKKIMIGKIIKWIILEKEK